jgi:sugar lactone lactonase YvrE
MYLVSDQRSNRVIALPAIDSDALSQLLVPPTAIGGLLLPAGLCLDANRRLHIADSGNGRIVTFALDTATWTTFGAGALAHPLDVAVDRMNRIYTVDGERILRVDSADGSGAVVLPGLTAEQRPIAVTLDADDRLFMVDSKSGGLAFTEDGGNSWQSLALPLGAKSCIPVSVGQRREGGVLVVDLANRRVVAFEPDGTSSVVIDESDGLISPVCAREDGLGITVLDAGACWIRRFLPVGDRYIAADFVRGRRGDGTLRFDRPAGLSVGAMP